MTQVNNNQLSSHTNHHAGFESLDTQSKGPIQSLKAYTES